MRKPIIKIPPGSNLDAYLMTNRYNTIFQLEEGTYYASNANSFMDMDYVMLGNGCELIGAGSSLTYVMFSADPDHLPAGSGQVEFLTAGGRSTVATFVRIEGITVSTPSYHLKKKRVGSVSVHIWCDYSVVRDVQIVGVDGFRPGPTDNPKVSREGFGLLINRSGIYGNGTVGSIVEDVSVTAVGDHEGDEIYVCGVYVGMNQLDGLTFVDRVKVFSASPIPVHASFGFNGNVQAFRISNHGVFNRGIFCDTGGGHNTTITQARLTARCVMMEFRGAGVTWKNIELNDSLLTLQPTPGTAYCAALVVADDGGASFDNVSINRSTIRVDTSLLADGSPTPLLTDGSDNGRNTSNCGIFQCRMIGPWRGPTLASTGFSTPNQKPPIK